MAVDRTFRCFPRPIRTCITPVSDGIVREPRYRYSLIFFVVLLLVIRSPLQDEENPREFLITFDNIAFRSRPITDTVNCSRWYRSIRRL